MLQGVVIRLRHHLLQQTRNELALMSEPLNRRQTLNPVEDPVELALHDLLRARARHLKRLDEPARVPAANATVLPLQEHKISQQRGKGSWTEELTEGSCSWRERGRALG